LHGHEWLYLCEAPFADAGDDEQMFDATERAVVFTVRDDARGEAGADAGQTFEFRARRCVDVEARRFVRRSWRERACRRCRRLRMTWQLDAGDTRRDECVAEGDEQECERVCFHCR
jgi:hypothetical protein